MSQSLKVDQDNIRLDRFLRTCICKNITQAFLESSVKKGLIKLDGKKIKTSTRCNFGQIVDIYIDINAINKPALHPNKNKKDNRYQKLLENSVIYEDENIVAINKPFDLPVQSGSKVIYSIDKLMKKIYPNARVVHRLDKHTTGVLVFAKNIKTATAMWQIFKERQAKKRYLAIVVGKMKNACGQIKNFIKKSIISQEEIMTCDEKDGDIAITDFKVIKACNIATIVELMPQTGRKHQLRAHMNHIGHPILNDGKYGRKSAFLKETGKKMNLHACSLEFELFGKAIKISAKIPQHIKSNVELLFEKQTLPDLSGLDL